MSCHRVSLLLRFTLLDSCFINKQEVISTLLDVWGSPINNRGFLQDLVRLVGRGVRMVGQ